MNSDILDFKYEFLLDDKEERLTTFPVKYPDIWSMYKKQRSAFWIPEEIDFSNDYNDWNNKINDDERYFLENIIAFFASSDTIVNMNITENFGIEVKVTEAKMVYNYQKMMEDIHSETYSLLINTYITDDIKKNNLFNGVKTIPCINKKAEWAMKWIKNSNIYNFPKRLIAFAIVEGVFFSGAFCSIYWIKQRGILNGLCISNELISRDEGMHCEFACLLYNKISNKVDVNEVNEMFREALTIEKEFINVSLPCKLIGMNSDMMASYLEFVADRLLVMLGYNKIFNSSNPFPFMDAISLQSKTNFFEHRVSQYQKSTINSFGDLSDINNINNINGSNMNFTIDDF